MTNIQRFLYSLKLIWRLNPRWIIWRIVATLGNQLIPIAQLVIAKNIIDHLVAGIGQPLDSTWQPIVQLLAIEAGLFLLNAINGRLELLYDHIFREQLTHAALLDLAKHSSQLDPAHFDNPDFHHELSRLQNETDWRLQTIYQNSFGLLGSCLTILASSVLFLQLPLWILGILTITLIPTFLVQSAYGISREHIRNETRPKRRQAGYYFQILTERFVMKDIKILQSEPFFLGRTQRIWADFVDALRTNVRSFVLRDLAASLFAVAARTAAVVWLAISTLRGALSIGQFSLFASLMIQFAAGLRGALLTYAALAEHLPFMDYHRKFFETDQLVKEPAHPKRFPAGKPITIKFEKVSFRYPGQTTWALKDISFELQPGEHLALVGENGAGKTTMIKLLARFYDPASGRITLNGIDLREFSRHDLYRYLTVMFQDFAQFQSTVKENIALGETAKKDNEAVTLAAKKSGATGFIEKLPQQYETLLSREFSGGVDLSGGQWQKVALARSFYRRAGLIILDEPTAALDATAEEHFYRQFLKLEPHVSAILISHRFSTVRMADRILVIEGGKLIESGNHNELMTQNGRYAKLFNLQAARYQ